MGIDLRLIAHQHGVYTIELNLFSHSNLGLITIKMFH